VRTALRFRSAELLKEVRVFFYELHEDETRYAHAIEQVLSSKTDIFMQLKKNTDLLVVLTLLQRQSNTHLATACLLCHLNLAEKIK